MKRPEVIRDLRGISGGHNRTNEHRVHRVIEHIMKFPKCKSHYRRNYMEREFLNLDTMLGKMYDLYKIPTNIVFYKRQYWVYNIVIRSGKKHHGHCSVWVEGEAGRGAQEVSSCLKTHISEQIGRVKKFILRSDACGGQNRNTKIALILKTVLEQHPTLEKLTMKFLMPGHSLLPNDSDLGDIESFLKLQ
ncbi:hypothetical protein PR048_032988 [Dryococelus australis]|uniref:Uncharacterized protein n=1 Tax=Dryococelus australis TaxID=614101 RepID=A0ABQ9G3U0_9NEOP|nr:hypothetical protein PR048_032988 [Dryococelus australis]